MPPQNAFDPSAVAQDHDFLQAGLADKIAYLSAQDPDFAKASHGDQVGYIQHLTLNAQQLPPPPPGVLGSAVSHGLNALGVMAKGAAQSFAGALPGMALVPQSVREPLGIRTPAETAIQLAQQLSQEDAARKAAGYSVPYRALAPVAEAVGANVPKMEQAAKQGDVGGVIGEAAAPMAVAASPFALESAGRIANRVIPSTTRAGAGLSMLTDSPQAIFAEHPVEPTKAVQVARQIRDELEVSGEKPPTPIQHFLNNMDAGQPINFYEARTLLKRVNDQVRASGAFNAGAEPRLAINNLKRFGGALDQDISAQAHQEGFGPDYDAMRTEYLRGKQIIRGADALGSTGGALAGYELGRMAGEPLGGAYIGGKIGKGVAKYTTGAAARALVERQAGPPRLRTILSSPEAYTRTLLDAKEGIISPDEANRRIQSAGGSLKTRRIPQQP